MRLSRLLSGLLVSAVGAPLAVVLDSATYLYSAITLRKIELDDLRRNIGVVFQESFLFSNTVAANALSRTARASARGEGGARRRRRAC